MSKAVVQFNVTLNVTAPTEQHVTDYCITHLKDRGYSVVKPGEKRETVKAFIGRLGICHMTLYRSLAASGCPHVKLQRGPKGKRVAWLISNPAFEEFVLRNRPS